jgi:membrane associated rhomboid family serine protease
LAGELAERVGCAAMGGVNTEGDWLGYEFVLLLFPRAVRSLAHREWMANKIVCVVYRTNTFPLVHANFFHAFMNILALTPLLERFEAEYGTLTTLALFLGRTYNPLRGRVLAW